MTRLNANIHLNATTLSHPTATSLSNRISLSNFFSHNKGVYNLPRITAVAPFNFFTESKHEFYEERVSNWG